CYHQRCLDRKTNSSACSSLGASKRSAKLIGKDASLSSSHASRYAASSCVRRRICWKPRDFTVPKAESSSSRSLGERTASSGRRCAFSNAKHLLPSSDALRRRHGKGSPT